MENSPAPKTEPHTIITRSGRGTIGIWLCAIIIPPWNAPKIALANIMLRMVGIVSCGERTVSAGSKANSTPKTVPKNIQLNIPTVTQNSLLLCIIAMRSTSPRDQTQYVKLVYRLKPVAE